MKCLKSTVSGYRRNPVCGTLWAIEAMVKGGLTCDLTLETKR